MQNSRGFQGRPASYLLIELAGAMEHGLVPAVPLVRIPGQVGEEGPEQMLHPVLGRVMQGRVMSMVVAVAEVRIEVLAQLRTALEYLHGGKFVAML